MTRQKKKFLHGCVELEQPILMNPRRGADGVFQFFKNYNLKETRHFSSVKKNNRYFSSSVSPSDERNTQTSLLSICYEKANARKGLCNRIAPQAKSLITQCKSPVAFVFKPSVWHVLRCKVEHTQKMKWYKEIFAIGNQQQYPYISF